MHRAGFGNKSGSSQQTQRVKIAALALFMCLMTLAIGVPLISKPKMLPPPTESIVTAQPTPVPTLKVFFALKGISPGAHLQLSMFKIDQMNAVAVAALGREVIQNEALLIGKAAKTSILPGTPVFADQVGEDSSNAMIRKIRPGFRAVTIKVDDVAGIEGWSAPGARVDVVWITQSKGETVVSSIVKNVQVLSVMGRTDIPQDVAGPAQGSPPNPPQKAVGNTNLPPQFTVSLLVNPEEGQRIMLASASGRLALMLRGEYDAAQEGPLSSTISSSELLNRDRPAPAAPSMGNNEQMEGSVRVRRDDGSYDEWSVIQGKIWKWAQPESAH